MYKDQLDVSKVVWFWGLLWRAGAWPSVNKMSVASHGDHSDQLQRSSEHNSCCRRDVKSAVLLSEEARVFQVCFTERLINGHILIMFSYCDMIAVIVDYSWKFALNHSN